MYIHTPGPRRGVGTQLVQRFDGMGCADCGGACGQGLGLFDSGMDVTGWGALEWGAVIVGGYMVLSSIFTTSRAVGRIKAAPGERRKRRAAAYRKKAAELSRA